MHRFSKRIIMDYGLLWLKDIPNWKPVYGGVRGLGMPSRRPAHEWKTMQEAGIKLVIDLRDKDTMARLKRVCEQHGMNYYHYPIHTNAAEIEQMVEHFEQFCQLIDAGDFYIASSKGLHRMDISLCVYWMFYAADKGIKPPLMRGCWDESGHNIDKINRIMNALYAAFTERNGVEPMSQQTFKERKAIIARQTQQY